MSYSQLLLQFRAGKKEFNLIELSTRNDHQFLAHAMVNYGHVFDLDHPCLQWVNDAGWSIAHLMAMNGITFPEGHPALRWKGRKSQTVAMVMAMQGHVFPDNHACMEDRDDYDNTVFDYQIRRMAA